MLLFSNHFPHVSFYIHQLGLGLDILISTYRSGTKAHTGLETCYGPELVPGRVKSLAFFSVAYIALHLILPETERVAARVHTEVMTLGHSCKSENKDVKKVAKVIVFSKAWTLVLGSTGSMHTLAFVPQPTPRPSILWGLFLPFFLSSTSPSLHTPFTWSKQSSLI